MIYTDTEGEQDGGDGQMAGKLYLCATPIGNLADLTFRVLDTLKSVDLIAAEDTRHSIKLLNHYDIKTPMTSYHEYNKFDKAVYLTGLLQEGKDIALITDAGTPGISDPGEELVKQACRSGIEVTSLPGPAALITALTLSGIATRRFVFEGFLPSDKKDRTAVLGELSNEMRTIILYEAPHHLKGTLEELKLELGDRKISVCRELTKKYETVMQTSLLEAIRYYEEHVPKGEYVLVLEGRDRQEIVRNERLKWEDVTLSGHMGLYLEKGLEKKEAMKAVAADRGLTKREVYQLLLEER